MSDGAFCSLFWFMGRIFIRLWSTTADSIALSAIQDPPAPFVFLIDFRFDKGLRALIYEDTHYDTSVDTFTCYVNGPIILHINCATNDMATVSGGQVKLEEAALTWKC